MRKAAVMGIVFGVSLGFLSGFASADGPAERVADYTLMLESRGFVPDEGVSRELTMSLDGEITGHMILQFRAIPDAARVSDLESQGIRLVGYLPNNAYFASVPSGKLGYLTGLPDFRSAVAIRPDDKISPYIRTHGVGRHARNEDGTVRIAVVFFGDVDASQALGIAGRYGSVTEAITHDNTFMIDAFETSIGELSREDEVQWIEQAPPEKLEALDDCRATNGVEIVQAPPYSLDGSGVTLGLWDSGSIATTHQDFTGRLTIPDGSPTSNHGTGVGGCMAGDGTQSQPEGGTPYQWRGMAPSADIVSYDWPSSISNLQTETSEAINTYGAISSNNSWIWGLCGAYCSSYGVYDDWSQEYDRIVRGSLGDPITVVFAAGNDQDCFDCQDSLVNFPYGTVAGPGGTAKNTIVVGASNAIDKSMTWFSSWGPVKDGRVKPDIAAPGCKPSAGVTTTYPPNDYTSGGCGTSYAAPITAGSVGLLKQQFDQLGYGPVKPHTFKAVLIQSAEDHGNAGPDYQFGHGHLEVQDAIDIVIANDLDGDLIRVDSVNDSEADTYNMAVPAGVSKLRVTLVWDDFEATLGAAKMLVNDLDLLVQSPGGTWSYAYKLNPASPSAVATTGYNDLDNVEVVEVSSPAEGKWTIRVEGSAVPEGPQEYTLVLPYNYPLSSIRRPDQGPSSYELHPGTPNPFSALTLIRYDLPEPAPVTLSVYDARGRLVKTLVDEPLKTAGRHMARWDGTSGDGAVVSPGIYFYRIDTGVYTRTRRMVVIR